MQVITEERWTHVTRAQWCGHHRKHALNHITQSTACRHRKFLPEIVQKDGNRQKPHTLQRTLPRKRKTIFI